MFDIVSYSTKKANVDLSKQDLLILQNSLNNEINKLDPANPDTALGGSRYECMKLFSELNDLYKRMAIAEAAAQ